MCIMCLCMDISNDKQNLRPWYDWLYIDGLVQDCCNSIANALELLQSCTKPSIYWDEITIDMSY